MPAGPISPLFSSTQLTGGEGRNQCCQSHGLFGSPQHRKQREKMVLLLERQTSVEEMVGVGRRRALQRNLPAFQLIPYIQSWGPTLPFPLQTLQRVCVCVCVCVCVWRVEEGRWVLCHLCSAALSYLKQDFKDPRVKIPLRALTRLPSGLHNLLE